MATTVAKIAYPSSAPPRPYSLPSRRTGVHGPSPSSHPIIAGCLSRWPYINTVDFASPATSMKITGVRPSISFTSTVLMYGHLDKQPAMIGWEDGLGPWTPVLRDGKLYGRGGADD